MKFARPGIVLFLLVLSLSTITLLGLHDAANATPTMVTNRAGLGATDLIDWGGLGPPPTPVPNGSTISSNGGSTTAIVSMAACSGGARIDQATCNSGQGCGGWHGNFAPGDHLLWTENTGTPPPAGCGPMTIRFTNPVAGAGAQIEQNYECTPGCDFLATLSVFDPSGAPLATFTENGSATLSADNSAIFLGAKDATADIGSMMYGTVPITFSAIVIPNDFAINQLSLAPPVPEPSTLSLLGSGLPVFAVAVRRTVRRRGRSPNEPAQHNLTSP